MTLHRGPNLSKSIIMDQSTKQQAIRGPKIDYFLNHSNDIFIYIKMHVSNYSNYLLKNETFTPLVQYDNWLEDYLSQLLMKKSPTV